MDIIAFFSTRKINITMANMKVDDNLQALITIGVEITNIHELDEIMNKIKGVEGVMHVHRI